MSMAKKYNLSIRGKIMSLVNKFKKHNLIDCWLCSGEVRESLNSETIADEELPRAMYDMLKKVLEVI